MADWLQVVNTFVNLETMSRVGQVAQTQHQILSFELQKQSDNALVSQLVDALVKSRQFIQDRYHFDALISASFGLLLYQRNYPQIFGADLKLKAAEIQGSFLELIKGILLNSDLKSEAEKQYSDNIKKFLENLENANKEIEETKYTFVPLNREMKWMKSFFNINVGDQLIATQDLVDPQDGKLIFRKYNCYQVVSFNHTYGPGYVLLNEKNGYNVVHFGENGGANRFLYPHPPFPTIEREISTWKLISHLFGEDFLNKSLLSLKNELTDLHVNAYLLSKTTVSELIGQINEHESLRRKLIYSGESIIAQELLKRRNISLVVWLSIAFAFFISLIVYPAFSIIIAFGAIVYRLIQING